MEITEWQRRAAQEGMYHFPTEGNREAERYCAGCASGEPQQSTASDLRNRVRCRKLMAHRRNIGLKGEPEVIPAGTPGCKHWEARDEHPR